MAMKKRTKTTAGKKKIKVSAASPKKKAVQKKLKKEETVKKKSVKEKAKGKKPGPKKETKEAKVAKIRRKPSPVSAFTRHEILKKLLIRKREDLVKEAKSEIGKYIKGEATQLVETALDDGDWSVIDLSADINLKRLETHRENLLRIDEALRKLKEGSYGTCEDCGEEISAERLKVMPFAIYCRDCQEKREEIERVTREEVLP